MQTQEDHSNPIPALNVDSLKVDLVVIQNTCSEKEYRIQTASTNKQLTKSNLSKDEFQEDQIHGQPFRVKTTSFRSSSIQSLLWIMTDKYFVEYIGIEVNHFRDTLLQHMGNVKKYVVERTRHQRQYNQKCKMKAAGEGMIQMLMMQISDPFMMKSQWLRSKTIEQKTSLLANNADLKAQIQKKVIIGKTEFLPSLRNQSVVRQPSAFKSERPQMSKQRFASQVDVNNNSSRPVTQHYLPKRRESVSAKPDHMITSSESRNSSKSMPRFSSNDMVHNYYLDKARKKTQERDRNSKSSVMPFARFQSTADDSKPKPRNNNQTPRSLPISKSSYVTITVVPKADHSKNSSSFLDSKQFVEVNSRAKIQSHKTKNSNKPVDQKRPSRQIFTGDRFSPNKTSAVYEKTSPRSDLRWKPTGRIFKSVSLRSSLEPQELESLFGPLFDEYFNGENQFISKSSVVTTADASDKRQQQPYSTSSTSTLEKSVTTDGNFDLSYALSWKSCQGGSSKLNLPDHRSVLTEPEEYDGKGGAVVLTRWIKKMENGQDMSGCSIDQKVKYTAGLFVEELCPSHEMKKLETELWKHAMVGAGHAAYTDRFHKLARLVPHLVTLESRKIESALIDKTVRNGSIKKVKKRGNVGEPSKDKNGRDDNKRTRTGNAFATTVNPDFRGVPRNVNPANVRNPTVRVCYECGSTDHIRSACPRLNRAQGPGGNYPNQVVANNEGQGRGNPGNQSRGRAFMLGGKEAR
ncbi:gag-pol polyprotein [Tanacetum coccineum]